MTLNFLFWFDYCNFYNYSYYFFVEKNMNIQQKITELEEQARFLQTQAKCLQMMQNMSSS